MIIHMSLCINPSIGSGIGFTGQYRGFFYCTQEEKSVEYRQSIGEKDDVIHIFIHNYVDKWIFQGIIL